MMKKTILFSTFDSLDNPFYGGGGAVAIHELAKRLGSQYNTIIITGNFPGKKRTRIDGVLYHYIGLPIPYPHFNQLIYQCLIPFYGLFARADIWFEGFTPPFSISLLPIFRKKPVIGITHFLDAEEKAKQYHLPFDRIERFGLRFYTDVIALTLDRQKKILSINPSVNVSVIPNGTDLPIRKNDLNTPKPYVLSLGRIEIAQKGLDLLIQAFSSISDNTNLSLVIAGSGIKQDIDSVKKMIKEHGLTRRVKVLHRVEGEEKVQLIRNATALVISSRFEGQSLTAIEALTQGTPIVCFDIPGLQWISNRVALKANAFHVEELGKLMVKIGHNASIRQRLARQSLQEAKVYTWDNVRKQYMGLISKKINGI